MEPTFIVKRANELSPGDIFQFPGQDLDSVYNLSFCHVVSAEVNAKSKVRVFGTQTSLRTLLELTGIDYQSKTYKVWEFDQKLKVLTNFDQLAKHRKAEIAAEKAEYIKMTRTAVGALTVEDIIKFLQTQNPQDYVIFENESGSYVNEDSLYFDKP